MLPAPAAAERSISSAAARTAKFPGGIKYKNQPLERMWKRVLQLDEYRQQLAAMKETLEKAGESLWRGRISRGKGRTGKKSWNEQRKQWQLTWKSDRRLAQIWLASGQSPYQLLNRSIGVSDCWLWPQMSLPNNPSLTPFSSSGSS